MAKVNFYDLELNIPKQVWSPNTCKTRFALNYKNIPYETKWVQFKNLHSTVSEITKSGKRPTVPIIQDLAHDNTAVQDSWDIAVYLEEAYPNTPSLFHGNIGVHKFFYDYSSNYVVPLLFKMVVLHVAQNCGNEQVQHWFRKNREERFGSTLEQFAGDNNQIIPAVKQALIPIHNVLKDYPYLTGDKAGWADITLAAHFTMLDAIHSDIFQVAVLSAFDDQIILHWWNRMETYRTGTSSPQL